MQEIVISLVVLWCVNLRFATRISTSGVRQGGGGGSHITTPVLTRFHGEDKPIAGM
jgi:hypothetical protein